MLSFIALGLCALGLILATLYGFAGFTRQAELGATCIHRACMAIIAAAVLTLVGFASGCAIHMPETPGSDDDEPRQCAEPVGDYDAVMTLVRDNGAKPTCAATMQSRISFNDEQPTCTREMTAKDSGCTLDVNYLCTAGTDGNLHVNTIDWQVVQATDDTMAGEVHMVFNDGSAWESSDCVYLVSLTRVE